MLTGKQKKLLIVTLFEGILSVIFGIVGNMLFSFSYVGELRNVCRSYKDLEGIRIIDSAQGAEIWSIILVISGILAVVFSVVVLISKLKISESALKMTAAVFGSVVVILSLVANLPYIKYFIHFSHIL